MDDLEDLRLRWALSGIVARLAEHVIENPREARSTIDFEITKANGEILGGVDVRSTLIEQDLSQDTSIFVFYEPNTSFLTKANHLIVWCLKEAEEIILSAIRRHNLDKKYEWVHERAKILEDALRNQIFREILLSPLGQSRPGLSAIRSAARTRVPMYLLALKAFMALEDIEALKSDMLCTVLEDTMLAPLEAWQRFELATAIAVSESLEMVSGASLNLSVSIERSNPIIRVGDFDIFWQKNLNQRENSQMDPSEVLAKQLAEYIGSGLGSSRADISVIYRKSGKILAHIECKWFESEGSAAGAINDATVQIVRYARDTIPHSFDESKSFLSHCVIVVASKNQYPERIDGSGPIFFTDFEGFKSGMLEKWAKDLVKDVMNI